MNITLGLRTLALLAFLAASTAMIVEPQLIGGKQASCEYKLNTALALGRI